MVDFTSALYLGLRHATGALQPWVALTTGKPAALVDPPRAAAAERRLAALVGSEAAVLAPSTLHVAIDLGGLADPRRDAVLLDAGAYPILRWAAQRAKARGVPVVDFAHHDPHALRRALRGPAVQGRRPLVLADGLCPACGGPAPLRAYREVSSADGGRLVIDDTQALGILGERGAAGAPYGTGGGGSLRWHDLHRAGVLSICSGAKALGAPVAALCGEEAAVAAFRARSETRTHCSPPSAAAITALRTALQINDERGDRLRGRLLTLVTQLRARLSVRRLAVTGGPFPVQGLPWLPRPAAQRLHRRLLELGVATVPQAGSRSQARIVLLLTARHSPADVDAAVTAIAASWTGARSRPGPVGRLPARACA